MSARRPRNSAASGDRAGRYGARARDLDEAAALAAKQRAEDAVRERTDKVDIGEAQAELARAVAQIGVIRLP